MTATFIIHAHQYEDDEHLGSEWELIEHRDGPSEFDDFDKAIKAAETLAWRNNDWIVVISTSDDPCTILHTVKPEKDEDGDYDPQIITHNPPRKIDPFDWYWIDDPEHATATAKSPRRGTDKFNVWIGGRGNDA